MAKVHFQDQIRRNNVLSFFLLALAFILTGGFIWVITIAFGYDPFFMLIIATVISLVITFVSYANSSRIALASVGAYPAEGTKFTVLNNLVEGLSMAAGIPKPKVYVMPSKEINAFAAGTKPEKSVVCVTEGALEMLSKYELEGVIAHELSHIKHYDIRYITIVTVVVGLVAIVSQIMLRSLFWGGIGGRRGGRDNGGGLLIIIGILLAILAPIVLRIVYFAISRKREFMADAGSVQLTRNPNGLINALKKIEDFYSTKKMTKIDKSVAPMYISDPYKIIRKAFSTHPATEDRIKALEKM
ncbi:MAG TPA: zinc metalloprotease HtpX [Candidatus Woesearchaeota archaeon]|nr:zinc metalloprotease HtpX [Candidatus Woesearchaeota archaeon]